MIAPRGTPLVELDRRAFEYEQPFGIITVDGSDPREIDDGIAVEALPSAQELYRVYVFVADTSDLYTDTQLTDQVIDKTEARYLNPQTHQESYEPMLAEKFIRDREFTVGRVRSALAISFLVGAAQPPSDVAINYGRVEVSANYRYDKFGSKCRYSDSYERFGRAAALILAQLDTKLGDEERAYSSLIHVPSSAKFKRGAEINQAFMVGANHLVANALCDDDVAIFRVHDPADRTFADFMDTNVARFSTRPGLHMGLGLDRYTRVTSPLRRVEDFIMHGLLRARHEGRPLNKRDRKLVTTTVQRLNQRIASDIFNGRTRQGAAKPVLALKLPA